MGWKLWHIATAPPAQWIYQADFSTMVRALGIELPAGVALALRLAAALGTLALAWRAKQTGDGRSFAFAVLILSGCYITLFGPRNEFLSFIVVTPSIALLAALLLNRNASDYRGWLLIAAALVLGFAWTLAIDAVLKPAIVTAIYVWLAWLMAVPARGAHWWRAMSRCERARAIMPGPGPSRAPNRPKPAEEAACPPRGSAGRSPIGSRARREEP
jgi:hypothetical protein